MGIDYSVVLMSTRANAPYRDRVEEDGAVLIYEGHDEVRHPGITDPKDCDQPLTNNTGGITENGKFHQAAQRHKREGTPPERVRVYEKLRPGIWSYSGLFHLVDSWVETDGRRNVIKFKLIAVPDEQNGESIPIKESENRRLIPTGVKLEVWKRDKGRCVICGASSELHFDHIIPYSRAALRSVQRTSSYYACVTTLKNATKSNKVCRRNPILRTKHFDS